jgi:hypothetical protein
MAGSRVSRFTASIECPRGMPKVKRLGKSDGSYFDGMTEGNFLGTRLGNSEGWFEGFKVRCFNRMSVRNAEGMRLGKFDGSCCDGMNEGNVQGTKLGN